MVFAFFTNGFKMLMVTGPKTSWIFWSPCFVLICICFLWILAGTPALTSRGFTEDDFEKVAEYFDRAVGIAVKVKNATGETLTLVRGSNSHL